MNNIWLIRHAESHSNIGAKTTHPATSSLTKTGELQSARIADYINIQPDIIIHSPYIRTLQSAQPTINKFPTATVDEWPVQEFTYLPHEKYLNSTQNDRASAVEEYWQQCDPWKKLSIEAESFIEFLDRMDVFLKKLKCINGNLIVFTHGHVIRAMIWRMLTGNLQKDQLGMQKYRNLRSALYIPNAVILKINMDETELCMSQMITTHLSPELLT